MRDHDFHYATSNNPLHLCQEWGASKAKELGFGSAALLWSDGAKTIIEVRAGNKETAITLAVVTYNHGQWFPCLVGSRVVESKQELNAALDADFELRNPIKLEASDVGCSSSDR